VLLRKLILAGFIKLTPSLTKKILYEQNPNMGWKHGEMDNQHQTETHTMPEKKPTSQPKESFFKKSGKNSSSTPDFKGGHHRNNSFRKNKESQKTTKKNTNNIPEEN
jgi:hypothetical protein